MLYVVLAKHVIETNGCVREAGEPHHEIPPDAAYPSVRKESRGAVTREHALGTLQHMIECREGSTAVSCFRKTNCDETTAQHVSP